MRGTGAPADTFVRGTGAPEDTFVRGTGADVGDGMSERAWRWRIGVASALTGATGVVATLRLDLGAWWAAALLVVLVTGIMLALRGVHHRIDQATARRTVFYGGDGNAAWVLLLMLSISIVPGALLSAVEAPAARALLVGLLAAGITAVSHGILATHTTPEPQPPADPMPLSSPECRRPG